MQLHVQGMTCAHCVRSVTRALQAVDPAASVDVDLASGEVTVSGQIARDAAISAIEAEGYAVETSTDAMPDAPGESKAP
jgi:copper chaperone